MKKPNRLFAPIVIAGITVGFLASAYKFVTSKASSSRDTRETRSETMPDIPPDDNYSAPSQQNEESIKYKN